VTHLPIQQPEFIYTSNREQEIWNFISDLESERFCYDFIKERIKRKNSWKRANQIFKKKKSLKGLNLSNRSKLKTSERSF
jgi:hypothetical protein